jgi:hypothetical protein
MSIMLSWIAFVLGTLLCLINFYLSFLRYPLHRLCGLSRESYRWESGIPIFGSLFVGLSLFGLYTIPWMLPTAITIMAVDTGGLHWFIGVMIYQSFHEKRQKDG